ncbi:hypothetical protein ENSA7_12930 [Enhygromyxa salina]|uniref:Tyrosine specific protein phosphatases domain-containing protein n=1 Tax=Enhygromyxa salina TaxID=215803 RepID=A0A2S9YVE8_9BACT|nr:hypothetical protein ENSA7_12930 [Enhygromyxa salina]
MSRENWSDNVAGTNIWIGRRPTKSEAASFDHIFDVTAEFPASHPDRAQCIPNLDGMPLADHEPVRLPDCGRTLVHCAQGHGRSAAWLAFQLVHNGLSADHRAALSLIQRARPKAQPSRDQLVQLGLE